MTGYDDEIDGVVVQADDRDLDAPDEPTVRGIAGDRIALVDLLDRVLASGVVAAGEVTLSIADVDMVTVSLRALVTSVSTLNSPQDELRRLAE
ncbi:MAG: gas vesicle protein [Streptosporangiaceae bacterium]